MRPLRISLPLLLAISCACEIAATKPKRFVTPFVPPTPKPVEPVYLLTEPPPVEPSFYQRETPLLLAAALAPRRSMEVDARLRVAEDLYALGAALMAKGEAPAARAEFDHALETLTTASARLEDRDRLVKKYQDMVEEIHRLEVEAAAQAPGEQEPVFDKTPLDDIVNLTFPIEPGLKGKVKEQLRFTVSQLPLEMADPVLSFINYFSSPRGKSIVTTGLKRAGRWAPMIRRILDEEGVPQELIYLAQAESGFLPRAVSYKSATGMWQFMQFRGREYGLMQTASTDDRLDPEKATRAAARHLRDLYAEFGDWYLAIAAYNCGPGNVVRAVERTGYADFWELYKRNVLPRETANYLPIILAITIMTKNPKDYGLEGIVPDPPLEYDTIMATANTHLAMVADLARKPLQSIRDMNPGVLKLVAPSAYPVHVPKGSGRALLAAIESIPAQRRASWRVHRVGTRETMASIARQYGTSEKQIADANGERLLEPQAGDVVLIPVAYPGPVPDRLVRSTPRSNTAARKPGTAAKKPAPRPAPASSKAGPAKTPPPPPVASQPPAVPAVTASVRANAVLR